MSLLFLKVPGQMVIYNVKGNVIFMHNFKINKNYIMKFRIYHNNKNNNDNATVIKMVLSAKVTKTDDSNGSTITMIVMLYMVMSHVC